MHKKGLTQAELADKLGYTQPHIANIINGKAKIGDRFRWRWVKEFGPAALRVLDGDGEAKT
jgi:plasmid maintenance system antidote protein VapI